MSLRTATLLVAVALSICTSAHARPHLVRDIFPERTEFEPWTIVDTAVADGLVFFTVSRDGEDTALWRSDGTGDGTFPLHSARPDEDATGFLRAVGSSVLFTDVGEDGALALWATDGTLDGTVRLAASLVREVEKEVQQVVVANGLVFVTACNPSDCSLWATDGSPAGTRPVKDFYPVWNDDHRLQYPLVTRDGLVFFVLYEDAERQVWRTDGTSDGTLRVTDADDLFWPAYTCTPGQLSDGYDPATGVEPWVCDASTGVWRLLADVNPGPASSDPGNYVPVKGHVLFSAQEPASGRELWRTDGTAEGTVRLTDIYPGWRDSSPAIVAGPVSGGIVFTAFGTQGKELWVSDGTPEGTVRIADVGDFASAVPLGTVRGTLLLGIDDADGGRTFWRSDGTVAGTYRVMDLVPRDVLGRVDERLVFTSVGGSGGAELWQSDGTSVGTVRLASLPAATTTTLTVRTHDLLFTTCDPGAGCTLWRSDGTPGGTSPLGDLGAPGERPDFSDRPQVVELGENVLFDRYAADGTLELWKTNGTSAGTARVARVPPFAFQTNHGSEPGNLTPIGSMLLFTASTPSTGRELWRSDGTDDGTALVADLCPGARDSHFGEFVRLGEVAFFTTYEADSSSSLWRTDGTEAGTTRVLATAPGQYATSLRTSGTRLFFIVAGGSENGLWTTDAAADGAVAVHPLAGTTWLLAGADGTIEFATLDGDGVSLWRSDGTPAGTVPVTTIGAPGDQLWGLGPAVAGTGGRVFFTISWRQSGVIIYVTDGTSAGTAPVVPVGYTPRNLLNVDGTLYYLDGSTLRRSDGTLAGTSSIGTLPTFDVEVQVGGGRLLIGAGGFLWQSDGTANGTRAVSLPAPQGFAETDLFPLTFAVAGDTLFFATDAGGLGAELWAVPLSEALSSVPTTTTPGPTVTTTTQPTTGTPSTTTVTTSTTSTTIPCGTETTGACDDGDPCTVDGCDAAGCTHRPVQGLDAVRCLARRGVVPPACNGVTLPPPVVRAWRRALTRIDHGDARRSIRALRTAARRLARARGRGDACVLVVHGLARDAQRALATAR